MSLDVCLYYEIDGNQIGVFDANITHNLGKMADEANIYEHLWMPEELSIDTASELIGPLSEGLAKMKANPRHYKTFNSPNGWGMYENFVPWVEKYLEACKKYPSAKVSASR